jgi:hypothetical protein
MIYHLICDKSTHAIKASVAQVNRQTLRPKCPCFVLLIPHFTLSFEFACEIPASKDTDINCTSNSVHICTAGCQPLLQTLRFSRTTAARFRKLTAYIVWRSFCGQNLLQFANHCCPAASTVHVMCTFAEPQNSLPKNAHEHYHDLINIAYINSHVINSDFAFVYVGGCQPSPYFQDLLVPRSFLMKWP